MTQEKKGKKTKEEEASNFILEDLQRILKNVEESTKAVKIPLEGKARFVKIKATRYGIIPEGRPGGGNEAWLFVDELILN